MDKFSDYIRVVLEGICISKVRRNELSDEIRDHLEMIKRELIKEGYSNEQAEINAIERFGKVEDIKKRYRSIFTPYRRFSEIINKNKILKESFQWSFCILLALMISLTIRSYAFASTEVKQCSMQNTLFEGQKLIESKIEYLYSKPQRGDIVIINIEDKTKGVLNLFIENTKEFIKGFYIKEEDQKKRLIKRIIGTPGDEIDLREGKVYINGELYEESYVKGATYPKEMKFPITVPEKEYFVMGDNRENSMDSRDIGFISIHDIEGKAVLRMWPLNKVGGI